MLFCYDISMECFWDRCFIRQLIAMKLVAVLVGIVFSLILSLIVRSVAGRGDTSVRLHPYCVPAFLFPADAWRTYCPCFSGSEPISIFVCLVCA